MVPEEIEALRGNVSRSRPAELQAASRQSLGMWRYADVLPSVPAITLGEGWTPLVGSRRNIELFVKDEGRNPGGSIKSRAASVVMSVAASRSAGVLEVEAEDGADVLYAYAARAQVTLASQAENRLHGCDIQQTILQEALFCNETAGAGGHVSIAELSQHGVEGLKTVGYEIVEQLGWSFPARVICPAGDDVLPVALRQSFEELEALGWAGGDLPDVYVAEVQQEPATSALDERYIAVSAAEAAEAVRQWAREDGLLLSLTGGAAAAAARKLGSSIAAASPRAVVFVNPENAFQQTDVLLSALGLRGRMPLPASLPVGGIITPV